MSCEDIQEVTTEFHNALLKKPVDEKIIVNILSNTTNAQRQEIRAYYKQVYDHPIQNDISANLSNKFKDLCIAMFDTIFEYDAKEIHRALHSFMNDDKAIVEIFASRPKSYFSIIEQAYLKFYNSSLREDLIKETPEEYSKYLLAIMDTDRPEEQTILINDAYEIAKKMNEVGLKTYGKDVNLFIETFLQKSREDLILISRAYNELFKVNLYQAINNDVGGKNRRLMKGILFAQITPGEWFAKKLSKAIQGLGTDTNSLNRTLISRSEIDMYALRDYYYMAKKTDIFTEVQSYTTGSYGEVLCNLSLK